jgi:hypothetical protein
VQAQLALMEVAWPEGLYDNIGNHQQQQDKAGMRTRSKGRGKCRLSGCSIAVWGLTLILGGCLVG